MKFKLIMVFVDTLKVEAVLDAGRAAGATGATILPNARGQGLKKHLTFFGLEYLGARAILLFVVEARRSDAVMAAVTEAGGLDESIETGIALEIDLNQVTGLSQHIRLLEEQLPLQEKEN